jgi:hypothetical protein
MLLSAVVREKGVEEEVALLVFETKRLGSDDTR